MREKKIFKLFLFLSIFFMQAAVAAPNNGRGDTNNDLKGVCELAGGTFTSGIEGTWACCWDNWGCAGCVQGVCTVKCHTKRCRVANRSPHKVRPGYMRVKGFEKFGSMTPIVPTLPH